MKKKNRLIAWMLILVLACSTVSVSGTVSERAEPENDNKAKVTLTAVSNTSIKAKWQKEKKYSYYNVYRMAEGKAYQKIATVKGNTYTDKNLKKSTLYKYKVRPYRYIKGKKSYGAYSSENSAAAGTDIANYTLELSQLADSIDVGVDAGTADCGANKKTALLYRSTEKDSGYQKIGELKLTRSGQLWRSGHFTDKQVSANQTYYYKLKVKKTIGGKTYTSKFSAPKAVGTASIDGSVLVDHYAMDLKLDEADKKLSGDVTMTITNKTTTTIRRVCIRNFAASVLKDLGKGQSEIERITLEGKGDLKFETERDPSVVYADLGKDAMEPGKSVSLTVTYCTDIPEIMERFGYHQDDNGQTFQLSFCFPILDRYENGMWNENPYIDGAECTFNRVTDYDVTLRGPAGYTVIASGSEETKDSITTIKARDMRDMSIVVSNCLEKRTKVVDGVEINHYLLKGSGADTLNNCFMKNTEDAVALFNKSIGRYPYDQLDVVQAYIYGGMEFPGLVMMGVSDFLEELKDPYHVSIYEHCSILLVHEVAHEWFYAAVGNDQYREPWLDEGFAEYCAAVLYLRSGMDGILMTAEEDAKRQDDEVIASNAVMSDEDFDKYMQYEIDQMMKNLKRKVNSSYEDFPSDDPFEYTDTIYTGGMLFLYELQKAMGDQKFFAAMQEYYKTYCLKEVTTKDFLKIIRRHDDSEKIEALIDRYIRV